MKKHKLICLILCASMTLTGCAATGNNRTVTEVVFETRAAETAATSEPAPETVEATDSAVFTNRDLDDSYSEADSIAIVLNENDISCNSPNVSISGSTVTIQKEGTYLLSGTLTDGSVIVDADKADKIQLVLNGASIHSQTTAPIYVRQADKVFVTLAAGSQNNLSNGGSFAVDGDTNIDSVIFSKDDLTLNGTGTLTITSPGGHGIVSKDSLRITGGSYVVDVSNHGLSGKDEVSIADGTFTIIAGKDGIHAENSEDADAGFVYLENGTYQITASGDGISASGSCKILDGDYTITTGGGSENGQQSTANPDFGRGRKDGAIPTGRQSFGAQDFPERGADREGGKGMNPMDRQPMDGESSATPKAGTDTVSTKGIKAGSLTIVGGSFHVDSADDGLHASGNVTLLDGTLEIASGDDGIHADETVTVAAGQINITQSYEGIEGQHVFIQGGDITLKATDDGLNAAGGMDGSGFGRRKDSFTVSGDTPGIVISGGTVYITASGDGIDANGTLEITGGTVMVSGPSYGDTSVLDFDITGTISGGTFIGTGASTMAQTFTDNSQGVISANIGNQSAGTRLTLIDTSGSVILSHTPELDFEIVILSAPAIQSGEGYTLCVGNETHTISAS